MISAGYLSGAGRSLSAGATVVATLLALMAAPRLSAQDATPKPVRPNTLAGVVTDTLGAALAGIDVTMIQLRRHTRTRDDGTFLFDSVAAGTYYVSARGIGLVGPSVRATVDRNGGYAHIRLIRFASVLPSVVTLAKAGGLSGIIGDTAYRALADVSVTALGINATTSTDSSGAFYMPLKPGQYMVRLDREGFDRQLVSVTIPEDEGRRVAAWMVPRSGPPDRYESQMLFELNQRLIRERGIGTQFYSHEDIEKLGVPDLQALARRSANGVINGDCWVSIAGGERTVPLWTLTASELEFVEVYLPRGSAARPKTSINDNPTKFLTSLGMRPLTQPGCGNLALIVWLRH